MIILISLIVSLLLSVLLNLSNHEKHFTWIMIDTFMFTVSFLMIYFLAIRT